jgi:hypothetical protein
MLRSYDSGCIDLYVDTQIEIRNGLIGSPLVMYVSTARQMAEFVSSYRLLQFVCASDGRICLLASASSSRIRLE